MIHLLKRANGHAFDCLCFTCEGKRFIAETAQRIERRKAPRPALDEHELALIDDVLGAARFPYGVRS